MNKFKVLSLDGGGIRGYLSIEILANIEMILNQQNNENINIGQRFDLIVGTSTGGIIASALAIGKSAQEVLELYKNLIPKVFQSEESGIFAPKYSNAILREELEKILEKNTLSDVKTDLCITSVDVENATPRFHKSGYFDRNSPRLDEKLVDLALATASAPTYFPLVSTKHSTNLTDGGIVANNPSMVGLIDAMQINDNNVDNIVLISVGTGDQPCMPYEVDKLKNAGKQNWIVDIDDNTKIAKAIKSFKEGESKIKICKDFIFSKQKVFDSKGSPLIELLMESQSKLAHFQVSFLLKDNYLRINPKMNVSVALDDVSKLDNLNNVADVNEQDLKKLKNLLIGKEK
ncbi:MAG: patatin-like phospholipase family protein [Bacteroidales bacterium]|nr:patatin-like phospholipase family protein [Bacteroidales bacterium]